MPRITILQLTLPILVLSCSQITPPIDTIGAYEAMRKKTGQEHSHVEYCENNIVKLTISSRGELATRDIYVPRKAVVHFKNRDTLNTYPLGVRLAADCLLEEAGDDCRQSSKIWGINVARLDSAQLHVKNSFKHDRMELSSQKVHGLYVMQVRESEKTDKNYRKDDLLYTNFSPTDLTYEGHLPALYIKFDSYKFWKPEKRRCNWKVFTDEAIRSGRASHCDDLSEWKTYLSDFDALSDQISKAGEFAKNCEE